jgi:hypothetical protein
LSGLSQGALGRRWRDLAIAFTDRAPSGDAVGRIKVLLGRDGGGFGDVTAAQTLNIGATLPTSIKVVDLDDDGVVDLVVSAFGQSTSLSDGTIHFFQGHAAPGANVGFQPNQRWFTIPATTGIRPRALVAARFGNHSPAQPLASMGIAAINAPDLNSLAVFQGNGQGSFVQPSLVTTPLGDDDHLFVSGDFHSGDGSSPLQDLAFITKANGQNVLRVLQANGAGGFALPDPGQPPLLAGNSPSLMAAGQFVSNGPTGVAIIDDIGGVGQQPLLKIFFGQGNGLLTAGTELLLNNAGQPRAIATEHFRGPDMPLDIAIAGDTTPPGTATFSGKLTLLFNDGQGGFTLGASQALNFVPSSLGTSSRLSSGGKADLLIRDANANRFLFLVNIGDGTFRLAIGPNQGFFTGAGNVDALLVGNVAHSGSNALDDVVTFDRDMTLKIFVNNGSESFDLRTVAPGSDPHFVGAAALPAGRLRQRHALACRAGVGRGPDQPAPAARRRRRRVHAVDRPGAAAACSRHSHNHGQDYVFPSDRAACRVLYRGHSGPPDRGGPVSQCAAWQQQARLRVRHQSIGGFSEGGQLPWRYPEAARPGAAAAAGDLPHASQ